MIISIDYFNTISQNQDISTEMVEFKTDAINFAQDQIEQYIGYSVDIKSYIFNDTAISNNQVKLASWIDDVTTVKVNDEIKTDYVIDRYFIKFPYDIKGKKVLVEYTGGFDVIPGAFKIVAADIASLKLSGIGLKIATTGTTFPDGMGFSRNNFTNFSHILSALGKYRLC